MATKTSDNDKQILTLKKQIEDKKKALKATERFSPITNCSIELDGVRSNIQVLSKEQLVTMLIKLNSYRQSAEQLGFLGDYVISGYGIDDWLTDLKNKLMNLNRRIEQERLANLESKLHSMLSGEKKIELEIDEISKMI